MIDEFDRELRDRLARMVAAVPVAESASVERVRRGPVQQRATAGPLGLGRLLPVVALAVIGTLVASLAGVGPFAPGSSGQLDEPVTSTTVDGPFELTVRSPKARYVVGEPIQIEAALTYRGPDSSIDISHGSGSPFGFSIVEPVDGMALSYGWRSSCAGSTLERDVPLLRGFGKSGGYSNDDPAASRYAAWFADPELHLRVGTWHPYAVAQFSEGRGCQGMGHDIRAEIAIEVVDAALKSESPTAEASAEPRSSPGVATVRDGDFELTIRSSKARYSTNEAIDVRASLIYRGPKETVDIWPLGIWFGSREPISGGITMDGPIVQPCVRSTLERDVPYHSALRTWRTTPGAIVMEPVPRLPEGTWHLYAAASASCSTDPSAERFALQAEIAIEVTDDVAALTQAPTVTVDPTIGPDWSPSPVDSDGSVRAVARDDLFELRLEASSDSGFTTNTPIILNTTYEYLGPEQSLLVGNFAPEVGFSLEQLGAPGATGRVKLYDSACSGRNLSRGIPIAVALSEWNLMLIKAVALGATFDADLKEGILRLPTGQWRISAYLATYPGGCPVGGSSIHAVSTSIDINVIAADAVPPFATSAQGGYELTLAAIKDTFLAGEPIEVQWSLVNAANPDAPQVLAQEPLVAFSARELGGSRHVEAEPAAGCGPFGLWAQGDPVRGFFEESAPLSNWSDPAFVHGFGQDRDVYLPAGTWVLSATTRIFDARCEATTANLQAEITITIVP